MTVYGGIMLISNYISLATTNTNREILFDPEDLEVVQKYLWAESAHGYAVSTTKPQVFMHHLVVIGDLKPYVDHINHNKLDNRRRNLRGCTSSQNQMNRQNTINSSSKYKGVSLRGDTGTWRAEIYKNAERYHLGTYKSEDEAALAYNEKALELHGEFALLNIVEDCHADS